MSRLATRLAVALGLASVLGRTPAHATLIATESFTDSPGLLSGRGAGTGWNGPWITGQPNVFVIQAADLGGGPASGGGSLFFDGSKAFSGIGARVFRALDLGPASAAAAAGLVESHATRFNGTQPALGKSGTVVWLGAVFDGGTAGNGLGGVQYLDQIHLYDGPTTTPGALAQGDNNKDDEVLAIGRGNLNTVWNYERTCSHDVCPGGSTSSTGYLSTRAFDNATHWLVMRFDFTSATATQITTWLDPTPGALDPTNASAVIMAGLQVVTVPGLHFNWIELGGQTAQFSFDEIRFATTFGELSTNGTLAVPPGSTPAGFALAANPTPFTDATSIAFQLERGQFTDVRIVDVLGRTVRRLTAGVFDAGPHTVRWDGLDDRGTPAAAGVYLVRARGPEGERAVRIVRMR